MQKYHNECVENSRPIIKAIGEVLHNHYISLDELMYVYTYFLVDMSEQVAEAANNEVEIESVMALCDHLKVMSVGYFTSKKTVQ